MVQFDEYEYADRYAAAAVVGGRQQHFREQTNGRGIAEILGL
jgi:hypothetical protein